MDLSNLAPDLARVFGINPASMVLYILILTQVAKAVGRRIPNDATGGLAVLRTICTIIGADPSSVVTTTRTGEPVTVQDVAAVAAKTPPIPEKVAAEKAAE